MKPRGIFFMKISPQNAVKPDLAGSEPHLLSQIILEQIVSNFQSPWYFNYLIVK